MLTVGANTENSNTITLPPEQLDKFGFSVGGEVELLESNDEIVLRPKRGERTHKILEATREIIERRRAALLEPGKGHE